MSTLRFLMDTRQWHYAVRSVHVVDTSYNDAEVLVHIKSSPNVAGEDPVDMIVKPDVLFETRAKAKRALSKFLINEIQSTANDLKHLTDYLAELHSQ